MPAPDDLVCLGAIAGAWGIQGAVRLKSFCADPAAIATYGPLLTEDGRSFGVTLLRPLAGAFAARLTGIGSREAAEAMKGTRLHTRRGNLRHRATQVKGKTKNEQSQHRKDRHGRKNLLRAQFCGQILEHHYAHITKIRAQTLCLDGWFPAARPPRIFLIRFLVSRFPTRHFHSPVPCL